MRTDGNRLDFLDNLRGVGVFMIVCFHALAYCNKLPDPYHNITVFLLHTISVPIFFLTDGFLFSYTKTSKERFSYLNYIKKSAYRLVLPWIIFSVLYALARFFFEFLGVLKDHLVIGQSFTEIIVRVYGSVYAEQLYFLLSLFIIRMASPMIFRLGKLGKIYMILIFVAYVACYHGLIPFIQPALRIKGGQEPILHALWGMQFYFAGIILHKFYDDIESYASIVSITALLLVVLLKVFVIAGFIGYIVQYLYLISLFMFCLWLPYKSDGLNSIGRNTMGIYLLHAPIVLKGMSTLINVAITNPVLSYLSISFSVFFVSYLATITITKLPYGSILFGIPYRHDMQYVKV